MYPFPQSVAPAVRTHVDAQTAFLNDMSKSLFRSFQQMCDLNIQLMQTIIEETTLAGDGKVQRDRPQRYRAIVNCGKPARGMEVAIRDEDGSPLGERQIGKVARPKNVWVVPDMPKTRSGKIMRRVIAGISNFADVGDVSTLANPEIVDSIRDQVQSEKRARGDVPQDLSAKEKEEIATFVSGSE